MNDVELHEREELEKPESDGEHRRPSILALQCGLGTWRPSWLQWLANHNAYTVAFILIGLIQGMAYTYFNGVVTTVEKVFHMDSRTMGIVVAGNDISQIMFGMFFTYVANRGNRPFWMAIGIMIGALACFIYASTQLFWDEGTYQAVVQMQLINSSSTVAAATAKDVVELCATGDASLSTDSHTECNGNTGGFSMLAAIWFFLGQFVAGIGGTTTYALGLAYLDDNMKKRSSPFYFGLTGAMRMLGPTLGYMVASICLKVYIKPYDVPEYEARDPRWLGAWWLGFLLIGVLQLLFAFPLLLFPSQLPGTKTVHKVENRFGQSTLKEFVLTLRRLTKNHILVLGTLGFCLKMFPIIGVSIFLPKYLEARFGQTAPEANVLTGLVGNMMIMVGVFIGGVVVWKFKPRTVFITGWFCVIEILFVIVYVIIMNLDCNDITLEGIRFQDGKAVTTSECSRACDCDLAFEPVCVGQQNFLSPCLAGCSTIDVLNVMDVSKKVFQNCSCGSSLDSFVGVSGFCEDVKGATCPNLWLYLALLGFIKLIGTSAHVGGLMINIRCVQKEDKGVAITAVSVAGSIFAFIPGPIAYGAAVDSTCLLWEETPCGDKGNCWLYDVQAFSYWFHGLAIFLSTLTMCVNIALTVKCRHLILYDEDDEENT